MKDIAIAIRHKIIELYQLHRPQKQISNALNISKSTVDRIIKIFVDNTENQKEKLMWPKTIFKWEKLENSTSCISGESDKIGERNSKYR